MITKIDEAIKNPTIRRELIEKLEAKFRWIGPPPNPEVDITTRCRIYEGAINDANYMRFQVSNVDLDYKIDTTSHIASYVLYRGDRGDKQVQHLCGVRHCANPAHLTLGYNKKNGVHASKTRAKSNPLQKSWKLSEPDKIRIRNLSYIEGWSNDLLAETYEVADSTITRILNS